MSDNESSMGSNLRRNGPLGAVGGEGKDQSIPTEAVPHPDTLNPSNTPGEKYMGKSIPKDNLGARGMGGA